MIEAHISQEAANNFRKAITIPDAMSRALTEKLGSEQKALQRWGTRIAGDLVDQAFTANPKESRTVESVRNLFFDPETKKQLDHRVLDFMDILTAQLRQGEKRVAAAEKALENFQKQIPSILEQASTLKIQFLSENTYTSDARATATHIDRSVKNLDPDTLNVYLTLDDEFLSLQVKYSPRESGTGDYKAIESIALNPQPQARLHKFSANTLRDLEQGPELVNLLIKKRNESLG